jgi:hypothetical protein
MTRRPIGLVLFLLVIISATVLVQYRWQENNWKKVIQSDGCGYYAYLPAIFIYQDLQYRFYLDLKDKYHFGDLSENFVQSENNRFYNRYFCGTSIALLPFFLLAWLASVLFEFDADGHSFLFHCAVNIGAITYTLLGLYFLSKVLVKKFSERVVAISIAAIFLATNLFYYSVYFSSYSHAYSFAFICFFIYLADKSFQVKSRKSFIHLALCAGMIVLIRPSNGILLLSLPFISGNKKTFMDWLRIGLNLSISIPTIAAGLAMVSIQSLLYYMQCGSWWANGYGTETFSFDKPELFKMWFSFRAGILPYSPVILLCFVGLISLFRQNKFAFFSFIAFMLINSWIISSWWAWHYSGTFGMRPMVDYMGFFVILLCYAITSFHSVSWKVGSRIVLLAAIIVGHILNYQKIREIIPYDNMNFEKYAFIFMKTEPRFIFSLDDPYQPTVKSAFNKIRVKHLSFIEPESHSNLFVQPYKGFHAQDSIYYSGYGEQDLVTISTYGLEDSGKFYVELKALVNYPSIYTSAEFEVEFRRKKEKIYSEKLPVKLPQYKPDQWNKLRFTIVNNEQLDDIDELVIHFRNGNKRQVMLQQLEITLATF